MSADRTGESGAAPRPPGSSLDPAEAPAVSAGDDDVLVVPLHEETLGIERRQVETGRVRIQTRVRERTEVVDEPVMRERADVERVPIGKVVDAAPLPREEGDTLVIPVVEERLVVERRLVVTEEIRVRKTRVTERHREAITLRSEEAEVARSGDDPPVVT
jgi:uncharacterized protein (TIGR02271 family)